jgi:diguanylate cyclase (GGDEF)-like protein
LPFAAPTFTRKPTNPSGVQRPPRLVLRFAVSTAVLLSIGAFVILIFVRQHAISQAESAAVFHSRFVVRSVLGDRLRPTDFSRPVDRKRAAMLDGVAEAEVLVGDSVAMALYNPDGRIMYARNRALLGTKRHDRDYARATLDGNVRKHVEVLDGRKVLKVFVPVPFVGASEPAGVLVLAQDYAPIVRAGRKAMLPVLGVLLLVLLTLYLSLFPLLHRVTGRLRAQVEQIEQLALYDALTGLANRRLFHDRLDQAFLQAQRNRAGFSLMLLDLDRFKKINDTLGHQTGDAVLEQFAARLKSIARASDTVARLGGDEFALILLGANDGVGALFVAERIRRALDEPFAVSDVSLQLETSIGVAIFPQHGTDATELLKRGDLALYASKDTHVPVVYASEHEHEELFLHFEPEIDPATGQTRRAETLG